MPPTAVPLRQNRRMILHLASCSCGQSNLVARGDPMRVSMGHCRACQRSTGINHGVQGRLAPENVTVTGASTEFVCVGAEATHVRVHFCPVCDAAVPGDFGDGSFRAVPVGAFADPAFPLPTLCLHEDRRHPWVGVPECAERLD